MGKQKTARGALLVANLPQLQNLIKRDPEGYREEFLQQLNHFDSIRQIFEIKPDDEDESKKFRDLIGFISQVAPCYPKETANYPSQLSTLLLENYAILNPETRKVLVSNLVLLRNKSVINPLELLQTLFPLLPITTSSGLRSTILHTILTVMKTANQKTKNHKLNRAVQAMLFGMVERGMDGEVLGDKGKLRGAKNAAANNPPEGNKVRDEAMWAVNLTKELWKKRVWTDAKAVSIVMLACLHPVTKVQSAAIHFFLGSEDDDEEEEEDPDLKGELRRHTVTKKKASSDRKLNKAKKQSKKFWEEKENKEASPNFPALQLLHDPQSFGERLYTLLNKYDKRFSLDHKVLIMQLLSRIMGAHQLCILGFYTYIIKYLTPFTLSIPSILACLAQSTHSLTPPSVLVTPIRKLASEFIYPGASGGVHAAGINAIREICRRQIWVMAEGGDNTGEALVEGVTEDAINRVVDDNDPKDPLPTPGKGEMQDLLADLVEYKKSKDKGVMIAARGLLSLYREEMPGLLKRRERGKTATISMKAGLQQPLPFGHTPDAVTGIDGLELLEQQMDQRQSKAADEAETDGEDKWKDWEMESDDSSSDSGGWIDVDSDSDKGLEISDSDDDEQGKKKVEEDGKEAEEDKDMMQSGAEVETQIPNLATTKILTPADFAMIDDLRLKAATKAVESGGGAAAKRKLAAIEAFKDANASGVRDLSHAFVSEGDIVGPRKRTKQDYAERMESVLKGREGRGKFSSTKFGKKAETGASLTNREKARNKPLMMVLQSGSIRNKKKASMREKQKRTSAHAAKMRKAR
ncbi:protein required for actin cytoskeleton organization and cell cycle progression [Cantharellus anzutake]|uniref:protein required for actin cytoskeleton organization and cell cycle progression n=1 Tax=Cantharellus anzutake TaxID=1750568 RepID=UPI0019078563|nr:protein required for actin cytoskeleton organization and cell cycle progression [Cantharellus anzutake]KAF8334969.1 protein required for actin cytoskeleton organization and cell cycle progression [Cantharellus anzutake]